MKGSYILLVELPEGREISIGRRGPVAFDRGFYAYVGSARSGLEARVGRHLARHKKRRWHIDYLLEEAGVVGVVTVPTEERLECTLARALSRWFISVPRFGASDCRCPSHLFHAVSNRCFLTAVLEAVDHAKRQPASDG